MAHCKEKLSKDCLVNEFSVGCKSEKMLGLEYERLPINKYTNEAVSYYGDFGVCQILREFAGRNNWDYILDNGELIGLKNGHNTITLEPGAQVELSVEPRECVSELKSEVDKINSELYPLFDKYNAVLYNYGVYPETTYKNIKLIPKIRYKYMANYLWGILSDVMMRETAGIQVGIDFESEEDAIRKFNLATRLSPFVTAMFCNSKIRGGVDTGYKSFRALAWLNTDSERCGFGTKLKKDMTFMDYIDRLLEVPIIYIVRDGQYIHIDGKINFDKFMKDGWEGFEANLEDFRLHSNLYFPEVRLRNFIEIRNHDCVDEKYMYSLLAFYKGIFYNPEAMSAIEKLLDKFTINDLLEFRYNVPRLGLETRVKGTYIKDLTKELLSISEYSLEVTSDNDLDYIWDIIELNSKGLTPCDIEFSSI